jgi:hypothetical protein
MPRPERFLGTLVLALVVVAAFSMTETLLLGEAKRWPEKKARPELTLRAYRVGEFLQSPRDWSPRRLGLPDVLNARDSQDAVRRYPAAGGVFDGLLGPAAVEAGGSIGPQEIRDLVQRTVNNQSDPRVAPWGDEGGPASIEYLEFGQARILLVSQTKSAHDRVTALFGQLREASAVGGRMLTIHVRWLGLEREKVDVLVGRNPKRRVPAVVDAEALDAAGCRTAYRAATTTFDRMRVCIAAGTLKAYVADAEPVCSEVIVGMDPTIAAMLVGALFDVAPILSQNGNTVLLDYASYINHRGKTERRPLPQYKMTKGTPAPIHVDLETPEVDFQTLRGSVRIPLDRTVLLGLTTGPDLERGTVYALVVEVSASEN